MKLVLIVLLLVASTVWADPNEFQKQIEDACGGIQDASLSVACKKVGASFLKKYPSPCARAQTKLYKIGLTQSLCTSISSNTPDWATSRVQCYQSSNQFPIVYTATGTTVDSVIAHCGANLLQKKFGLIPNQRPEQLSACYDDALQKEKEDAQLHLNSLLAAAPVDAQLNSLSPELTCKTQDDSQVASEKSKNLRNDTGSSQETNTNGKGGAATAGSAAGNQ
jgi:hypothetical protein